MLYVVDCKLSEYSSIVFVSLSVMLVATKQLQFNSYNVACQQQLGNVVRQVEKYFG
uniref:Uncharacterized protein n=1 Tax=Anguilla anguilla TaxID=7936 RepID=A0A0E9UW46_ANGAN